MSWTDTNTIKKHLLQSQVIIAAVKGEEHTLWGTDPVQLRSALITEDSEEVKTIDLAVPYCPGSRVFSGTNWVNLEHADLVPNSVVVTSDQHRNTIFIEGEDYVVDYEQGRVRRTADSTITDGQTVYVWYLYFTVHTKDTDYTIDYETGVVARIDGAGIANGEKVFVDYSTSATTVSDSLIADAILQAEDKILARLADGYTASSTDQGLITGATELAVAVICNSKAMEIMNSLHTPAADDISRQWREMSRRYELQAWRTLSRFLKKPAVRSGTGRVNKSLNRS